MLDFELLNVNQEEESLNLLFGSALFFLKTLSLICVDMNVYPSKTPVASTQIKIYMEHLNVATHTILPNMEYSVYSASKFYTPIANQFRVSCPKMNIFLEILHELSHLRGFKVISTKLIECSFDLSLASSKR